MLKEAEGIVIHSIKYGDNGRIVLIYTDNEGLTSFIVQGFTAKSPFKKVHFQVLNILKLNFYFKQRSKLQRLKEVKLIETCSQDLNIMKVSVKMFVSEILYKSIKEEESNPDLYTFLKNWIINFDQNQLFDPNAHLYFILDLSKYLGFYPHSEAKGENARFLMKEGVFVSLEKANSALALDKSQLLLRLLNNEQNFSNKERRTLIYILLEYYALHLENFKEIKSQAVLETVLS